MTVPTKRRVARICQAVSLSLAALACGNVIAQASDPVYDRHGNPLFTEDGTEITYTHSQLGERYPLAPYELKGFSSLSSLAPDPNDPGVILLDPNDPVVPPDPNEPVVPPDPNEPVSPPPEPTPLSSNLVNFEHIWQHSIWGANLGESGMTAVDLDDDGTTELVLGTTLARNFGQNKNWHIVAHHEASDTYEIIYTSTDNPDWYSDRAYLNVVSVYKGVFGTRILVGYDDGTLSVFDGATRQPVGSINVSLDEILSVTSGDGDNDGVEEIIVATTNTTYLYHPLTLAKESELPIGGSELLVGNVDNDPLLEMVYLEGPVVEFDGATALQQWDFSGFTDGRFLELGDFDNDGRDELVVARGWYYIDILDAQNRTPLRQITTGLDISQLKVADVTGDAIPEILYGDRQHGGVHAIDGVTLVELWELDNPTSGAPGIEVADLDHDGELEVIWGSGSNSTAPDFLSVHDIATLEREFISADEGGPFRGVALGDTDGDGQSEIGLLGREAESYGPDDTRYRNKLPLRVYNAADLSPAWDTLNTSIPGSYYGYFDLAIGNVDGVGADELVASHGSSYDLNIDIIDGVSRSQVNTGRIDTEEATSIALADFAGDERLEIAAASGNQLHIIDSASMATIWSSIVLPGNFSSSHIKAVDAYGDGLPDLVASLGRILVIDGVTKIYRQSSEDNYRGFTVVDWPEHKIIAGTSDGLLVTLDPDSFDRTVIGSVCDGAVNSVSMGTTPAFLGTIQFACPDTIGIYSVYEAQVIWRSPKLGAQVGVNNTLLTLEHDDQGILVVGTEHGAHAFRGPAVHVRDADSDGMLNHVDNCPQQANPNQEDLDNDGVGDACNSAIDSDDDEWADTLDNCPFLPNPGQEDLDNSGRGDACDQLPPGC